jgi:hypothetical protein
MFPNVAQYGIFVRESWSADSLWPTVYDAQGFGFELAVTVPISRRVRSQACTS